MILKTFKYRIRDSASRKRLDVFASKVNFVWNYCVATSRRSYRQRRKVLGPYDLNNLTSGTSKILNLNSTTVQAVGEQCAKSSRQHKKVPKFRSRKRSLGWIPFKASAVKFENDTVTYQKQDLKVWKSWKDQGKIRTGCFVQDARRRWYACFVCEVEDEAQQNSKESVGIDLGLKTKIALSDGTEYDRENLTKQHEEALARAQRARKKRQTVNIHAKIKNCRNDWSHKTTRKIADSYGTVAVGGVASTQIVNKNNRLAKSVYDAGWHQLRNHLKQKVRRLGGNYIEVNEAYSSQTCSVCSERTGPKGREGLSIREWECSNCGSRHDRDRNAAQNILRLGHQALKILDEGIAKPREGISALKSGEDVKFSDFYFHINDSLYGLMRKSAKKLGDNNVAKQ
jgi:putative transposase